MSTRTGGPEISHYLELTYSIEPMSLYAQWSDTSAPRVTVVAVLQGNAGVISADKLDLSCPIQRLDAQVLYPVVQNSFLAADTGHLHLTVYYGLGDNLSDTLHGTFYIAPQKGVQLAPLAWKEVQGKRLVPRAQFGQAVYAHDTDKVHFYTHGYRLPPSKEELLHAMRCIPSTVTAPWKASAACSAWPSGRRSS